MDFLGCLLLGSLPYIGCLRVRGLCFAVYCALGALLELDVVVVFT